MQIASVVEPHRAHAEMTEEMNLMSFPSQWKLGSLRITYFCDITSLPLNAATFTRVFELEHESELHKRSEFATEFSTIKEGITYKAKGFGPKVDFTVEPIVVPESLLDLLEHPILPDGSSLIERLLKSTTQLISDNHRAMRRIAVGMHFIHNVKNKDEGYEFLAQQIKGIRLDTNSSDFVYQINRKRLCDVEGNETYINRLSKWSCGALNVSGHMPSGEQIQSKTCYAATLVTDVNTQDPGSDTPFDLSELSESGTRLLLKKLFNLSLELANVGDIS